MTRIIWRGITLEWLQESWPKFSNVNDSGGTSARACYCEASPFGTGWKAEFRIGELKGRGGSDTPQRALDNALANMKLAIQRFEDATNPAANVASAKPPPPGPPAPPEPPNHRPVA